MNKIINNLNAHWGCDAVIYRESPIVSIADNYDRIGYPADGASRNSRYTRYVCDTALLRTMTSAMIPRAMQSVRDTIAHDILLACPGLCYRRDSIDRIHTGEPHQIDFWYITDRRPMTLADLRKMIEIVIDTIAPGIQWRIDGREHPYTQSGQQVDVLWNNEWVEIMECGIAHPRVIAENMGRNDLWGLAMGPGLDRLLMIAKNIPDIRLLRSTDPRVMSQMLDLEPYIPVSSMPPVTRDLSIVVDCGTDNDILGDRVSDALGDDANVVELVQILSETPYDDLPPAAISRLGISPGQKNILLRVILRALDRTLTAAECNDYRNKIYMALHTGTVVSLA